MDKDKDSSSKEMIDLEPLRNESGVNNDWRETVSYYNEPYIRNKVKKYSHVNKIQHFNLAVQRSAYPEALSPFFEDYPDDLNPFLDKEEGYPDEMNPFRENSEDIQIVLEDAQLQNRRDEEDSIGSVQSVSSFQANSPSGSLNNISDVISLDCLFSPLRRLSAISPNFDESENEFSTYSQAGAQDNNKQDCVSNQEQIEKDKDRYTEDRNILEKIVSPLQDDRNSEVIQTGSSLKTAPVPPASLNDPKERVMETCKIEKFSDIDNDKDSENQIKRGNSLTHLLQDNIGNNTVGAPSLASTESGKKDNKAKCVYSSSPKAENIMESLVVENCDRVVSSVRPSRKKRRAPLPPPLQKQTEVTTQEIGCSRNASKMTKINTVQETAVTSPRPPNRCGEKMKKDDAFPVVLKPTRPAPPVPIQHSQKADAGKKGVRGFWKRFFHRKK